MTPRTGVPDGSVDETVSFVIDIVPWARLTAMHKLGSQRLALVAFLKLEHRVTKDAAIALRNFTNGHAQNSATSFPSCVEISSIPLTTIIQKKKLPLELGLLCL